MGTRTICTIGYEGADLADFVATLRAARVQTLVDVRAVALSRRPGFSKTALASELQAHSIDYLHFQDLGDPKSGRDAAREGRHLEFERIFRRHLATHKAQQALGTAINVATDSSSCLLCYERDYSLCHRSIIADAMAKQGGFQIKHLGVKFGIAQQAIYERAGSNNRKRAVG